MNNIGEKRWQEQLEATQNFLKENGVLPSLSDGDLGNWLNYQRTGKALTPERSVQLTTALGHWKTSPLKGEMLPVGIARSGYGIYGVVLRDDDSILCYECGSYFNSLGKHLAQHEMTAKEYRKAHGLSGQDSLISYSLAKKLRERHLASRESNPELRTVFYAGRQKAMIARTGKRARPVLSPAGAKAISEAAVARRKTPPKSADCVECGNPLPDTPASKFKATCSDACLFAVKSRQSNHISAKKAGEELDFIARPGSGEKLLVGEVLEMTGVKIKTWNLRVRRRIAPPHDGRIDGARFWWASSIEDMPEVKAGPGEPTFYPEL